MHVIRLKDSNKTLWPTSFSSHTGLSKAYSFVMHLGISRQRSSLTGIALGTSMLLLLREKLFSARFQLAW